jgi:selenocysteine-specific elongation factor
MEPQFKVTDNKSVKDVTKILNINVGVLGHIDSGKTSLCKLISTIASTSAFDKVPQSQERGITLELGFSAFLVETPEWFKEKHKEANKFTHIQFTLVDCPGHASLIKTIIGGASIIDIMILVIDSLKGIQTQTAECLVIGEILERKLVIALNKVDLIENAERDKKIGVLTNNFKKFLKDSYFGLDTPIKPVIATYKDESLKDLQTKYLHEFILSLLQHIDFPKRNVEGSFIYSADHCFIIKGQGTVLTGTVLRGKIAAGDMIEIPAIGEKRKVKSLQIFRKPITTAMQGDRVGICVPQLDSKEVNYECKQLV